MEKQTAYTLRQSVKLVDLGPFATNKAINFNVKGLVNVNKILRPALLLPILLLLAVIVNIVVITITLSIIRYSN